MGHPDPADDPRSVKSAAVGADPLAATLSDLPAEGGRETPAATVADAGSEATSVSDECAGRSTVACDTRGDFFLSDPDEPVLGRAIPGYEIVRELGRGGVGVVYLARQTRLNRLCALKMILAGTHAGRDSILRFATEAETVAKLHHPHIVQVYSFGDHDGRPYLELEYLEGGSLANRLDGTPWRPQPAAQLVEVLARAIAEAHRLGIVHRDLKPGNVLLAEDGTPKVTDFGLAKSLGSDSSLTQSGAIMGTPSYMSPEQALGNTKQVGPAADVYALGAILYALLTGRPPFQAATIIETLDQVKSTEPVAPSRLQPGLPRDLETICVRCLQKDIAKRYDGAAALAADLHRYLAGEPILARRVSATERGWRWCRRNRAVAASLAGVMVTLLLGTIISSYFAWTAAQERHGCRGEGRRSPAKRRARRGRPPIAQTPKPSTLATKKL